MPSQRHFVPNSSGDDLAVIIETSAEPMKSIAMFSHCFTCSKDLKAIVKISRRLATHGIAVARFDFTGLGDSTGDFSESNFETNIADILSVSNWLRNHIGSPQLLMGISLGGAAMISAARQIETTKGLVSLATPSCTKHLAEFLVRQAPEIETEGMGQVVIGGRTHQIKKQMIESLRKRNLDQDIAQISVHHLILHSPMDETLGLYHAENLFKYSGGIKSFVTLDGADHLLMNQPGDVEFVADQIEVWSRRWREK